MHVSDSTRRGFLAASAALAAGCSATGALNALVPSDTYRVESGIAYGAHARQRLDAYRPLADGLDTPLVVFFYGGSWTRGERADYRFVGEAIASAGACVVVADYRLSPEVGWRDILADCAAAVHWAQRNTGALRADPKRLFVMGHSAGAYNAAMLALDPRWLGAGGGGARSLAGWVGIAGPYDFLPIGDPDSRRAFGWPDTPRDSQPIEHASAAAPSTLLIAGTQDTVVSTQRSTVGLARRLEGAGVPVRVRVLNELNHATAIGAMARPLRSVAPVRDEVMQFVRTTRNGRA